MSTRAKPRTVIVAVVAAVLVLAVAAVIAWRSGVFNPTGAELVSQANTVRDELATMTHDVALLIDAGAPRDAPYSGDLDFSGIYSGSGDLLACDDLSYRFTTRYAVGNVDGWRFPAPVEDFRRDVADQLADAGWKDVTGTSVGGDTDVTIIEANWPGKIDRLTITFHPGNVADGVAIYLDGACHPGNVQDVFDLLREQARQENAQ